MVTFSLPEADRGLIAAASGPALPRRMGMIPIRWTNGSIARFEGQTVRLIGSRDVQALTGLSADQLREWTGRRGLVRPDLPAHGKGTQARFSWQTVLVLRLACTLKDEFHLELHAHRTLFAELQDQLAGHPFHALWGMGLVLPGGGHPQLRRLSELRIDVEAPVLLLPLTSHLQALTTGFGLSEPVRQLPLFSAVGLR